MSTEIIEAMTALANEKGISPERLILALEDALLSAYMKQPSAVKYARVQLDPATGDFRVIELKIPERLEAQLIVEAIDEETYLDPETGEYVEPEEPQIDPQKFEIYRDQIEEADVTPDDFGRIAAQTAKQVILQRVREAERDMMFDEYQDRVGELVNGIVQQSDSRYTLVQLGVGGRIEALLPRSEQVDGERYDHGQRVKAVIKEVSADTKGPSIILSRRDPELIKALFELEVPEMADGLVEIANVAREPGYRSKIAVVSYADGVDPVGACVGPRGSRVRMVVSELRGEKIDIIPYNEEPARFVAKALSPARVREVVVDDEARQATVIVPDDQLALAIGREGQNARLAARLTGWRIDIRSESEFATEAPDGSISADEEVGGRCVAVLTNGRRCPNAALPGTSSCGLPAHIALGRFSGNSVALVAELSDEEIERFADPEVAAAELTERVTAIEAVVEKAQAEAAAVAAAQAEADALAAAQAEADAAQAEADAAQAEAAEGAEQAEAEDQDAEAEVEATEADDAEAEEAAVEETEVAETEEAEAEPEADAESAAPEETT
jgi:N utilization substance protein A